MSERRLRCVIYTRKSSSEGLDQDFNSLDAQREACEAYIKSQRHEGWVLARQRYDDGGLSGATMDRAALVRLLADVRAGGVDVVVVYKVDRLTRALSDFAKIVEIFDAHGVSFVSVTQQFNTTSSMGRLTLNVLLSFAQFEREVTAERIRDKIAASKKKGMWMGGIVPLGYDAVDKRLIPNETEATTVRKIFELYLEFGSVRAVKQEADRLGLCTKPRRRGDCDGVGRPFTRGHIYKLLGNPIYAGRVRHGSEQYAGEHEGIVDQEVWTRAQEQLRGNAVSRPRSGQGTLSLLGGLIYTDDGRRLTQSHTNKGGRRYRYYVTADDARAATEERTTWRLQAEQLEAMILAQLQAMLRDGARISRYLERFDWVNSGTMRALVRRAPDGADRLAAAESSAQHEALRQIIQRVEVGVAGVRFMIAAAGLLGWLGVADGTAVSNDTRVDRQSAFVVEAECRIDRTANGTRLVLSGRRNVCAAPDTKLVSAVAEGHAWFEQLRSGRVGSLGELARELGRDRADVGRRLRLAFLAPDIVDAILRGDHPAELTVTRLLRVDDLPLSWEEQRRVLGFPDPRARTTPQR